MTEAETAEAVSEVMSRYAQAPALTHERLSDQILARFVADDDVGGHSSTSPLIHARQL